MNLLIFLIIMIISFIVVRIGAIAFELTGLEASLAHFQSLSCFTGTGFTTRESELVTAHSQRRQIASFLMILGNVGLVTLIATFVNTMRSDLIFSDVLMVPFFNWGIPRVIVPWLNLLISFSAIFLLYKLFTGNKFSRKLTDAIRTHLIKKNIIKVASFEELTLIAQGYGVLSVDVTLDSPLVDKTIMESHVRDLDVTVLAIEREGKMFPNPTASRKIVANDKVVCFGKIKNIQKALGGQK